MRFFVVIFAILLTSCSDGYPHRDRILLKGGGISSGEGIITSIVIIPGDSRILITTSVQFYALASDAAGNTLNATFAWSTDASDVLVLDSETGLLSGLKEGAGSISVSSGDITSDPVVVTVIDPIASIEILPSEAVITIGNTQQFIAVARNSNSEEVRGLNLLWGSTSPLVATIDIDSGVADALTEGVTSIVAGGITEVSQLAAEGRIAISGIISDPPALLTVISAPDPGGEDGDQAGPQPASITIFPGDSTIDACSETTLTAQAFDSQGNQIIGTNFTWSSSDTSIVQTEPETGIVRGIAEGTAQVTAIGNADQSGIAVSINITVLNRIESITLSPQEITITAPSKRNFAASAVDSGGIVLTNLFFTWRSSNELAATIDSNGLASTRFPGITEISASCGTITSNSSVLNVIRHKPNLSWSVTSSLPVGLYDHSAVISKDEIIVVGGISIGGFQNNTYSSRIADDGTISEWTKLATYPKALRGQTNVTFRDHIFVLGGIESGIPERSQDTIFSRVVSSLKHSDTGTFDPGWTDNTPIPVGLFSLTSFKSFNSIFIAGGWDGTSNRDEVYSARVTDGLLSGWRREPSLPTGLSKHATATMDNFVYAIGGSSGGIGIESADPATLLNEPRSEVYRAEFTIGGVLSGWQEVTPLPINLIDHSATVLNGFLIVVGGNPNANELISGSKVLFAPIEQEGLLGEWIEGPSLPMGLDSHALLSHDNYLYVIGGKSGIEATKESRSFTVFYSPF